ncbi:Coiled-coil domain-containing protein 146 [Clonorchis sinensis]|uniref:Coiled-coil domain-containing protein 146 n=1 Tax=Clonorchis sinensis TaxID=79923 RepID=A0A8T1MB07_CLOSI|nr:Coiled-coil domain-containing protein 146 [Clonorchis sinensis]
MEGEEMQTENDEVKNEGDSQQMDSVGEIDQFDKYENLEISEDFVIVAQPSCDIRPKVQAQDVGFKPAGRNEATLSSSSASGVIELLENLCDEKLVSSTQASLLKNKYLKVYKMLNESRDSEFRLVNQSKQYTIELRKLEETLAKAENYPESYNTQADKLREELLTAENQLLCCEGRCDELGYIIEGLRDEEKMLRRECKRKPKGEELENQRIQLERAIEELQTEKLKHTNDGKHLIQTLKEERDALEEEQQLANNTYEQLQSLKDELSGTNPVPIQCQKECAKIEKQQLEAKRLFDDSVVEHNRLQEEMDTLDSCRVQLEMESAKLSRQYAKRHRKIYDMQSDYDAATVELEEAQQKAAEYALQKTEMELNMKHLRSERMRLDEQLKSITRERDIAVRGVRKSEVGLRGLRDAIKFQKALCTEKKNACEQMRQMGSDKELMKRRALLLKDVIGKQNALIGQCNLSESEKNNLEMLLKTESKLKQQLADLVTETVDLSRLATARAEERELKSRELQTATLRYARIRDEVKSKELQILEYEKSLRNTQKQLTDFSNLYNAIREERNNCMNLIQLAQQKMQEMQEKLGMRTNDLKVLQNTSKRTVDLIGQQRIKIKEALHERDQIRQELSKQVCVMRDHETKRDQLQLSIEHENLTIHKTKDHTAKIQNMIGRAIKVRDDRVNQLVERNEEVCVLQEKIRLQEDALAKGELELTRLDEQLRWLGQEKRDLENGIMVLRRKLKQRKELEDEMSSKQVQLAMLQDSSRQMELAVTDPTAQIRDPSTGEPLLDDPVIFGTAASGVLVPVKRLREVSDREPDPAQLRVKIDAIQVQLLTRERKLLECDLLLQAVNRLVANLQGQAAMGRDTTLKLAKKMNERHTDVEQTNKKVKAMVAELKMLRSMAFNLEREVKELRMLVMDIHRSMQMGDFPSEHLKLMWTKAPKHKQSRENVMQRPKNMQLTPGPERHNTYCTQEDTETKEKGEIVDATPPVGTAKFLSQTEPGSKKRPTSPQSS